MVILPLLIDRIGDLFRENWAWLTGVLGDIIGFLFGWL